MYLACVVQPHNILAQDAPHHILPREDSTICRKSKATKCRYSGIKQIWKIRVWTTPRQTKHLKTGLEVSVYNAF